jgi:hypothetical protein
LPPVRLMDVLSRPNCRSGAGHGGAFGECRRSEPQAPINTLTMSFKRNGELFEQPRIVFQSREASETERSSYRIAVAQMLKRCASLPFTEALGNGLAGQPLTMIFVDDRERPP